MRLLISDIETGSSIEEWLGANTQDCYEVLAATGRGAWHPDNDAGLWVKFTLRAHHMQAQTVQRRFDEAGVQWLHLDERTATRDLVAAAEHGLLEAHGERRGRYYLAGGPLAALRREVHDARTPLTDPYPGLLTEIRQALP